MTLVANSVLQWISRWSGVLQLQAPEPERGSVDSSMHGRLYLRELINLSALLNGMNPGMTLATRPLILSLIQIDIEQYRPSSNLCSDPA